MLPQIVSLIVGTAASVVAGVLLLRFWMQVVRVRPPASLSQFIFQMTDWLVRPLRRVFPGLILIGAVFSWVNPHAPLAPFVDALNEPLLQPLRRIVPLIGNLDLSPLVALVLLRIGLHLTTYMISLLA